MKITILHLWFYRECKSPTPSWVDRIKKTRWNLRPEKPDRINELINIQDEKISRERFKYIDHMNLQTELKRAREKGKSLRNYLIERLEEFPLPQYYKLMLRYVVKSRKGLGIKP